MSVCLSVFLSVCLSVYLPDSKRSSSARLPHFLNLTTSKTDQFCDTSFIFLPNNVQNRSNSADLDPQCLNLTTSKTKQFCETSFINGKLSAALGASHQCVLRFFQSTCVKYCACHEKLMPGHTTCRCSKMQHLSGNQRPDLLTSSMNMSFVLRLPREMHL